MKFLIVAVMAQAVFFLGACSSNDKDKGELIPQQARVLDLQSTDKYDWTKKIKTGEDGTITGGKRSRYDAASEAGGYRKKYKTPDYLTKEFSGKEWSGTKNYATGSFQGDRSAREAGARSRFQDDSARGAGRKDWMGDKKYDTGTYRTAGARESRRAAIRKKGNAQVAHREKVWGWRPKIYSKDQYRDLTVGDTRSLLGKQ